MSSRMTRRVKWCGGLCLGGLVLSLAACGCKQWVASADLPSPRYLEHPPEYIPPSPPYPLSRDLASQEAVAPGAPATAGKSKDPDDAAGKPRSILVKLDDLEDFTLKTGPITFNNFSLEESATGWMGETATGWRVKLKACYRNRMAEAVTFFVVVIGQDENENPLWACTMSNVVGGKDVGCLPETETPVPEGTLKRTTSLRFFAHPPARKPSSGVAPRTGLSAP
jgi:hypothetical protein